MKIYDFSDYKSFLNARIARLPKKGRGEVLRMAKHLQMHPTRMSHVLRGDVNLTSEQACELCSYLALSSLESEFFMALLQFEKAGSKSLKKMLLAQMDSIQTRAADFQNEVAQDHELTEADKIEFYSQWQYLAASLLPSLPEFQTLEAIAARLELSREKTRKLFDFLLRTGVCLEKDGRFQMGPKSIYLESDSPLIVHHHANWRLRALLRHEKMTDNELAFSSPVTIHSRDQKQIKQMIRDFLKAFLKVASESEPTEKLACLNIDWFEV